MKLAFIATQSSTGSTVRGRIIPLAQELTSHHKHDVHLLLHGTKTDIPDLKTHQIGEDPFQKTASGKIRLHGFSLFLRLLQNVFLAVKALLIIQPETIIIVKPLPENVLAVWLTTWFFRPKKIVLDVDDFELTANVVTSLLQRAVIHLAQRVAVKLANSIVVATPFLADYETALVSDKKSVLLIPTGLSFDVNLAQSPHPRIVYIGSLSQSSGHRVDLLPEIFFLVKKTVPNAQLVIIGDGDDKQKLSHDLQEKGVQADTIPTGPFELKNLAPLIFSSDVLVDPIDASVTNRAKSSFRVALALACGLPIVTSNVGIRAQLIPRQLHTMFFATPGDVNSYANKISALLQKPLTAEDQLLLKESAKQYTWEALAEKYNTLL